MSKAKLCDVLDEVVDHIERNCGDYYPNALHEEINDEYHIRPQDQMALGFLILAVSEWVDNEWRERVKERAAEAGRLTEILMPRYAARNRLQEALSQVHPGLAAGPVIHTDDANALSTAGFATKRRYYALAHIDYQEMADAHAKMTPEELQRDLRATAESILNAARQNLHVARSIGAK